MQQPSGQPVADKQKKVDQTPDKGSADSKAEQNSSNLPPVHSSPTSAGPGHDNSRSRVHIAGEGEAEVNVPGVTIKLKGKGKIDKPDKPRCALG